MNREKLTEATMLALQGKLVEAENKDNRKLNLMIRNATKYVNELEKAGFDVLACRIFTQDMGRSVEIKDIQRYSPETFAELEKQNYSDDGEASRACIWVTKSGMNRFYDVTRNAYGEAEDLDFEYAEIEYNYPLDNNNFDLANFLSTPDNEDKYAKDELANNDSTYGALKHHKGKISDIEQKMKDIEAKIDELHNSNSNFKNDEELQKLYDELESLSKEHTDGFYATEYERLKDKIKSRYNK